MIRLRAAVHIHSDWSFDGHHALSRIVAAFRRRGYGAVLTAEHCQSLDAEAWQRYRDACAALSTPQCLVVPGLEYRDPDNVVHVPTWGDLPYLGDGVDVGALLAEVAGRGGVAVLAHPGRHDAHLRCDPAWAPLVAGVEVWNRKYDGWRPGPAGTRLATDWGRPGVASLDFHRRRQFFPLATVLEVAERTEGAVLVALRDGRFEPHFARRPVSAWSPRALTAADTARTTAARALRRVGRSGG